MSKLTRNENGKFSVPLAPVPVRELSEQDIRRQAQQAQQRLAQVQQALQQAEAQVDHWLSLVALLDSPDEG